MTGDAGMAGQIQNGISGNRCIGAESVVGRLLGTGLGSGVFSVGGSKPGFLGFKAAIGRRESPLEKRTPPLLVVSRNWATWHRRKFAGTVPA